MTFLETSSVLRLTEQRQWQLHLRGMNCACCITQGAPDVGHGLQGDTFDFPTKPPSVVDAVLDTLQRWAADLGRLSMGFTVSQCIFMSSKTQCV